MLIQHGMALQEHNEKVSRRKVISLALIFLILMNYTSTPLWQGLDDHDVSSYEDPQALTMPPNDPPMPLSRDGNMLREAGYGRRLQIQDFATQAELPYGISRSTHQVQADDEEDLSIAEIRALSRSRGLPLRCATFGNSDTWGSMRFQKGTREASYAYQICDNVDNYGFYAQGPNYAQTCLQTMIGNDKRYDLITLDFDQNPDEVRNLSERLRKRFPKATIIIIDRYLPHKVVYAEGNLQKPMSEKRIEIGKAKGSNKRGSEKKKFLLFMKRAITMRHKAVRHVKLTYRGSMKTEFGQAERNLDIHRVIIGDERNLEQSMIDTIDLYDRKGIFLNQNGHNRVASLITEKVNELNVKPDNTVGDWGDGDFCHMWFNSGEVTLKFGPGISLNNYDAYRYALEIPPEGSWIEFTNPTNQNRRLWATYVVTPGLAQIHDSVRFISETGGINRHVNTKAFDELGQIITPRTTALGRLNKGTHRIQILSDNNGDKPFWLVGLSMSDSKNRYPPKEYGFGMSFWKKETHTN